MIKVRSRPRSRHDDGIGDPATVEGGGQHAAGQLTMCLMLPDKRTNATNHAGPLADYDDGCGQVQVQVCIKAIGRTRNLEC